jgi:hypothetical protein
VPDCFGEKNFYRRQRKLHVVGEIEILTEKLGWIMNPEENKIEW